MNGTITVSFHIYHLKYCVLSQSHKTHSDPPELSAHLLIALLLPSFPLPRHHLHHGAPQPAHHLLHRLELCPQLHVLPLQLLKLLLLLLQLPLLVLPMPPACICLQPESPLLPALLLDPCNPGWWRGRRNGGGDVRGQG